MYRRIVLLLLIALSFNVRATEGMWIPTLLEAVESDMQSFGCELSAEDIYSVNKSSLKDAIVHFGGGCTAEVISSQGLLLTNHHCGYSQIQSHSSLENDYLKNGFWAKNFGEELPNKGLTATFIVEMMDVSDALIDLAFSNPEAFEKKKAELIAERLKGSAFERASAHGCAHAFRFWFNEFREMSDVIIGWGINQFIGLRVGVNGCKAKILHMVGTAIFVEKDVPISPTNSAAIEIIYHGVSITLSI